MNLKKGDLVIVQSLKGSYMPYWIAFGKIEICVRESEGFKTGGYVITTQNNEEVPLLIYRDHENVVPIPKGASENQKKAIMALVRDNI